jgi:hypothetical protein
MLGGPLAVQVLMGAAHVVRPSGSDLRYGEATDMAGAGRWVRSRAKGAFAHGVAATGCGHSRWLRDAVQSERASRQSALIKLARPRRKGEETWNAGRCGQG